MAKPYDARLIMMVSQMPFETPDMNQFCKLIPVVYVDGVRALVDDFPNDGEVWWMLTARTAMLAIPGKLLVGLVENAVRYDENDSASSFYQIQRESIRDLDLKDGVEVLAIPGDAIASIQDLVSSGFRLDLPSPPTLQVMLRWRGDVYGPFRATRDTAGTSATSMGYSFTPSNVDLTVYLLTEKEFDQATAGNRMKIEERVSPTAHRRSEAFSSEDIRHDLVLLAGYERIFVAQPQKMVLEPIERKLQRYAKDCLSRKKARDFRALLEEMEITGRETKEAEDLVDAVKRIKRITEKQDAALDAVAKALLESGALGEDRIKKAEQAFANNFVQEQAAQLQAKAQEAFRAIGEELRKAQSDLKDVQGRLLKEESERRAKHDLLLANEREDAKKAIATEVAKMESQRAELERQQHVLQQNLEHVTRELREAGDKVVNRFLTIAPLLGAMGHASGQRALSSQEVQAQERLATGSLAFEIPSYFSNASSETDSITEEGFFHRFKQLVEESGFVYRPLDLQRFHLSVKCSEMTVLGGPSGTGKSSLPALYARALLGHEASNSRPGCLMVNVNPSWMDIRDLLGHMNTLEGQFYPAESGLFQHLIFAQEEFKTKGNATGLYLACLDEMNLSQVEHYFSDFMMVLDRDDAARVIQCFSPEVAKSSCQFRPYARLKLSPGAKFVGTVNFDETTRLLSDRFLDRVNLIRLASGSLPNVFKSGSEGQVKATGRMVTLSDFESWRVEAALPAELGLLLDTMRPMLSQIGCPLSPRAYRGICKFVASAARIMQLSAAFDVQIAQRVVPKVRSMVTKRQLESLDQLMHLLRSSSTCGFEESLQLLEAVRDSAGARAWDLED